MAHVLAHFSAAVHASCVAPVAQHDPLSPPQGVPSLPQHWVPLATHWCVGAQQFALSPHMEHPSPPDMASFCAWPSPLDVDESPPPSPLIPVPPSPPTAPASGWPLSSAAISSAPVPVVLSLTEAASAHVLKPHVRSPSTAHPADSEAIAMIKKPTLRRTALIMTCMALQCKGETRGMASTPRADPPTGRAPGSPAAGSITRLDCAVIVSITVIE